MNREQAQDWLNSYVHGWRSIVSTTAYSSSPSTPRGAAKTSSGSCCSRLQPRGQTEDVAGADADEPG